MKHGTAVKEPDVGRRKKVRPPDAPEGPDFERIEIQVPRGWTARIDRAARPEGMSRSGYIRSAILDKLKRSEAGDGQ
jgi:hypothetical protein